MLESRIVALCFCFVCLCVSGASAQAPLSPEGFRDRIKDAINAHDGDVVLEDRDELSIRATRPNEQSASFNFDHAYAAYQRSPDDLDVLVDRWARMATGRIALGHQPDRIVSVLRHRAILQSMAADHPGADLFVSRPFAGDLIEVLAFDSPEAVEYATQAALEELGLDVALAWTLAPANLRGRAGPLQIERLGDGLAWITEPNGLAPSRLADPHFCSSEEAGGLFLVVSRDAYISASGAVARGELAGLMLALMPSGRILSETLLECQAGRLAPARRQTRGTQK